MRRPQRLLRRFLFARRKGELCFPNVVVIVVHHHVLAGSDFGDAVFRERDSYQAFAVE